MPKEKDNRSLYVRVPLTGPRDFKHSIDGNFAYILGVNLPRLMSSIGLYQKDFSAGWVRYNGNEYRSEQPAFSEKETSELLEDAHNQIAQVLQNYSIFQENLALQELLQSIFDQKAVLLAAENRNFEAVKRLLQQYVYDLMGAIVPVVQLCSEVNEAKRINASLTSAVEHLPEGEQKYIERCCEIIQQYYEAIVAIEKWAVGYLHDVDSLAPTFVEVTNLKQSVRVSEIELKEDVLLCNLGQLDEEKHQQTVEAVQELAHRLAEYEAGRFKLSELVLTLMSREEELVPLLQKAKASFQDMERLEAKVLSSIYEQNWVSPECHAKVKDALVNKLHAKETWDLRLHRGNNELRSMKMQLLEPYPSSVIDQWKATLVAEPARHAVAAANGSHSNGFVTTDFEEVIVDPDDGRLHPQNEEDVMELMQICLAARTNHSKNFLYSMTFRGVWELIEAAGFSLRRVDKERFKNHVRNHGKVNQLEDYHKVGGHWEKTTSFHLMHFKVEKGTPASRERLKIFKWRADSKELRNWQEKWGVTVSEFKRLGKERMSNLRAALSAKKK